VLSLWNKNSIFKAIENEKSGNFEEKQGDKATPANEPDMKIIFME